MRPEHLDSSVTPAQLFAPLPADSSQLSAVVASASTHSFVMDGPPGTGKSQTIANMIAHNLALGRRVLFVAEKRAALDVVYRRLAEKGLGEFCLELHSSKASKVEVLKQLDRAWDVRDALSAEDWEREAARLQTLRSRLNQLVEVLRLFAGLAARDIDAYPSVAALRATSLSIQQQEEQLKAWCDWCRVREQAAEAGLASLAHPPFRGPQSH